MDAGATLLTGNSPASSRPLGGSLRGSGSYGQDVKRNKNRGKGTPEELERLLKAIAAQAGVCCVVPLLSYSLTFFYRACESQEGRGRRGREMAKEGCNEGDLHPSG